METYKDRHSWWTVGCDMAINQGAADFKAWYAVKKVDNRDAQKQMATVLRQAKRNQITEEI